MASSTTIPRTKMKAITVMVEILMSVNGRAPKVPINATGMPMATHMAIRNLRNSARMISTSSKPPPAFCCNTVIRSRKSSDVLIHVVSDMPGGNVNSKSRTASCTSLAIWMRSSSPTWETFTIAARSPLNSASRSPSSKVSRMVAISASDTRVPSARVKTITSSNS